MIKNLVRVCVLVIMFFSVSCGESDEVAVVMPVEDFFVKSEKNSFKLSPDGSKIAYIGIDNHCRNIYILDLTDEKKSKQLTYQEDVNVQYFFWTSDSTMVYSNSYAAIDSARIFSINIFNEEAVSILPSSDAHLRWVYPQRLYKDYLLASINARDSSVFDLYKVFIDGRTPELLTENPGNVITWFASSDGEVRLAVTSDSVEEGILYRSANTEVFKQVEVTDYQTLIKPLGFVKGSDTHIYALSNDGRDKLSVVEYDISEGKETKIIYGNSKVDIGDAWYSDYLEELVFSEYTIDRVEKNFFNKKFKTSFQKLAAHFEDQDVYVLNTDTSLRNWVVKVSTDVNSGALYHYDSNIDSVKLLTKINPKLDDKQLAKKQPISFQSRDGLAVNGYVTYPKGMGKRNLPVVVLIHDGPYSRDYIDFESEVQFLANRGYLVFQVNYRGSAGYGKKFWSAGFKEWGGKMQLDIMDGVTWLIHQGIVDKNRVAIMGTGFGGYSALYGATYNSSFYRCAISMSGYTNLFTYFKEIPPYRQQFIKLFYHTIGNPDREHELFKAISPLFHADRVRIPILFAQGGSDRYSSLTDANQFVQKVKNNNIPIKYLYKEDEGRRFRDEGNLIHYYQEVEAFLKAYLK